MTYRSEAHDLLDPPLVYRVLEELADGRVRYESRDGVQTGKQIGLLVLRDGTFRMRVFCGVCNEAFMRDVAYLDDLTCSMPLVVEASCAELAADEYSRRGDISQSWGYAMAHRLHRGLPIQSFREWQEEASHGR